MKSSNKKKVFNKLDADEELAEALAFFFDTFTFKQVKEQVKNCVETCLSTDHENFATGNDRANLIHFHHTLQEVLNVAYVFVKKKESKSSH